METKSALLYKYSKFPNVTKIIETLDLTKQFFCEMCFDNLIDYSCLTPCVHNIDEYMFTYYYHEYSEFVTEETIYSNKYHYVCNECFDYLED